MSARTIPRGEWTAPRFAAEHYVSSRYFIAGDDGDYSAHPDDYWHAADDVELGALMRRDFPYRLATGRTVYADRFIKLATVGDLRRLARAATGLVR